MKPLRPTEERYEQAQRVKELIELLESFLAGRIERSDITRWVYQQWPPGSDQGGPFLLHGTAHAVVSSIWNIEERSDEEYLVRPQDVAAYLEWLKHGALFDSDGQTLVTLALPVDTLRGMTRTQEIRYWLDGIGWQWELRFASAATGRCFVATSNLTEVHRCHIYKRRSDDAMQAVEDLVECLALAGPEITYRDEAVDLERLPRWALCRQDDNGQRYEMTTFLSYTRALREADVFERRGHKQSYWVERRSPAT
jgi:hypothetical protein